MTAKPALTAQQRKLTDDSRSPLTLYKEYTVGEGASWGALLHYELFTLLFSNLPGLPGFASRMLAYRSLLGSCGKKPAFGRGVVLRCPKAIHLGKKVLVDDYAALDVRGEEGKITLGDYVSVGRYSSIVAKDGTVTLGAGVNIGSYSRIATQSSISVGESTLISAYCYIGPGNHKRDSDRSLIESEMEIRGGVDIGAHAWIGAHCTIMDGVTIGEGAIIGAHSLVKDDVPPHAIAVGTPAKIIRRTE